MEPRATIILFSTTARVRMASSGPTVNTVSVQVQNDACAGVITSIFSCVLLSKIAIFVFKIFRPGLECNDNL